MSDISLRAKISHKIKGESLIKVIKYSKIQIKTKLPKDCQTMDFWMVEWPPKSTKQRN